MDMQKFFRIWIRSWRINIHSPLVCRGLVMPGATAWLDAPLSNSGILNSAEWWSLLLDIRCLWRHNMTSFSRLQTNVLAKFVDTTCIIRNAGAAAGGAVKEFRAMETYKKQKKRYQLRLFLFINNVDPKDHNRIIENHSEFSGCPNSCSEFVSSRPW